jgi:hypothetical protein
MEIVEEGCYFLSFIKFYDMSLVVYLLSIH